MEGITDTIAINRHQIDDFTDISSSLRLIRFGIYGFIFVFVCVNE